MLACTACLTLIASICISPVLGEVDTGWASQYAKGVFPRVVQLRQGYGQLPENLSVYDGFVATRQCDGIGSTVWLRPLGAEDWEKFLVADCASRSDSRQQDGLSGYEWMTTNGILVEIDHETAIRWGTLHRGIRVEMLVARPIAHHRCREQKYGSAP